MRVVIRRAGVVVIAMVAALVLAVTTTTRSASAATALMVGGILQSNLSDSTMSSILAGAYTDKSGTDWVRRNVPWSGSPLLGWSIPEATTNLYQLIMDTPGPKTVVGMSAGSLAAEEVLRRLPSDPMSPDPTELNFVLIADSSRQPFFTDAGGPLTTLLGYVFQAPAETRYTVTVVTYEYDGNADLPDRLWNGLAMANAMAGAFLLHNATFLVDLSTVPTENITTTYNSVGGKTTTYLIPSKTLPLVQLNPWLAPIEPWLKQQVDAGYTRNDNRAAITSSAVAQQTTDTGIESFSPTVDPPVDAPAEPVQVSARASQGSADAAETPGNATDILAKTTPKVAAESDQLLASGPEVISEKGTDLTAGNKFSPSTTLDASNSASGWKPGDGTQVVTGTIRQLLSGNTAITSPPTGTPTTDTSTQTDSKTSSSTSSSSGSGSTP